MKRIIILLTLIILTVLAHAQVVYEDINNTGIYDFLDELANNKVIELNSVVKPYSRIYITKKLMEAEKQLIINNEELKIRVNKRQVKELHFYLQDFLPEYRILINEFRILNEKKEDISRIRDTAIQFVPRPSSLVPRNYDHKLGFLFKKNQDFAVSLNPLAFQYQDRLFTLSVRPILGFSYMANENSNMYHRYWGASGFMYIRKYFGGYASLRDNYATQLLVQPQYLTLGTGGIYKVNEGGRTGGDWSEMRGGISVSWKWGSFGLMKDFFTWGNNYHGSNIFSDHAPGEVVRFLLYPWMACK
jgi:hypothetical protein